MNVRTANGAVLVYLVALAILGIPLVALMETLEKSAAEGFVVVFMFAPAIAAVVAHLVTGQHIRLGRPDWRSLLLAVVPTLIVAGLYTVGLGFGMGWLGLSLGPADLLGGIVVACLLAFGEELGWRGYLLPQLRRGHGYLGANAIVYVIWLVYHVPVILIPSLYSNPGIPLAANLGLFALSILGFSFYVGALWEVSHDVWAPTFAHGVWNSVVQSVLPVMFVADSAWLMGEFGVLAAGGMLVLFVVVAPLAARRRRGSLTLP
jgi:membrane protease YdiL (CAAX protease family)